MQPRQADKQRCIRSRFVRLISGGGCRGSHAIEFSASKLYAPMTTCASRSRYYTYHCFELSKLVHAHVHVEIARHPLRWVAEDVPDNSESPTPDADQRERHCGHSPKHVRQVPLQDVWEIHVGRMRRTHQYGSARRARRGAMRRLEDGKVRACCGEAQEVLSVLRPNVRG